MTARSPESNNPRPAKAEPNRLQMLLQRFNKILPALLLVAVCALAFLARDGWREAALQQDAALRLRMQAQAWEEEARTRESEFARLRQETLHQFGRALTERSLRLAAQGRGEEAFLLAGRALGFPGQGVPAEEFPPLLMADTPAQELAWLAMAAAGPRLVWESPWGRRQASGTQIAALSPDGRMLASADGCEVRLWDTATGRLLAVLPVLPGQDDSFPAQSAAAPGVRCLCFSPDGLALALGCADGSLRLLDTAAQAADTLGREISSVRAHDGPVLAAAFGPDDRLLASAGEDGAVWLWDVSQGDLAHAVGLAGHTDAVTAAAFTPDGRFLATGSLDGSIRFWRTDRSDPGLTDPLPLDLESPVHSLAFSPDHRFLAVGLGTGELGLWEAGHLGAGEPLRLADQMEAHQGPVLALAFAPASTALLSAGEDGGVCFWSLSAGQDAAPGSLSGAQAWDPDSAALVLAARHMGHTGAALSAMFGPGGEVAVTAGADHMLRFWQPGEDGGEVLLAGQGHTGPVTAMAVLRPGAPDAALVIADRDGRMVLRDPRDGSFLGRVGPHPGGAIALAAAPDGGLLVSAGGRAAMLWDPATGALLATLELPSKAGGGAAFSAQGDRIAVGLDQGGLVLWTLEQALAGGAGSLAQGPGSNPVTHLAFTPDGRYVAAAGGDAGVLLLDAASLSPAPGWDPQQFGPARALDLDAASGLLAVASENGLAMADLAGGSHATVSAPEAARITALRFGPGSVLACGCDNGEVLAFGAPDQLHADGTLPVRLTLITHQGPVQALAFGAQGLLATGGRDTATRAWDLSRDAQGRLLAAPDLPVGATLLALDGAGERLALATPDGRVLVAPLDGSPALQLDLSQGASCAAFSPDGWNVAVGCADGAVRLFDATLGQETGMLRQGRHAVLSLAYAPDGSRLAAGLDQGETQVWDLALGEVTATLPGEREAVRSLAFAPDSKRLITGVVLPGPGNMLWDLQSEAASHSALAFNEADAGSAHGRCLAATFAPQGGLVLALSGEHPAEALLFGLHGAGGSLAVLPEGPRYRAPSTATAAVFGPGGRSVVLASQEAMLRVFHAQSGGELLALPLPAPAVTLHTAPHAGVLAAGLADGEILCWRFAEPGQLPQGYIKRFAFSELELSRVSLPVSLFGAPGLAPGGPGEASP